MPNLQAFFRAAPVREFSGTVYRIGPARFGGNMVSMRGSFLHGARYNVRGYFGALYTSLSKETARREMARYFTVPPIGGFVEASIRLFAHGWNPAWYRCPDATGLGSVDARPPRKQHLAWRVLGSRSH